MDFVTVRAKVHRDETSVVTEIPAILTEAGPLMSLVEYFLEMSHLRSFSWMQKTIQSVGLLLDYMSANRDCCDDPKELFRLFVQRLYSGTIGEDGTDPSGLYWMPKNISVVNQLASHLAAFSYWMSERLGTTPLNPWRKATQYEEMLRWAAYHRKHSQSFLSHTWDRRRATEAAAQAHNTLLKQGLTIDHDGVKSFGYPHYVIDMGF